MKIKINALLISAIFVLLSACGVNNQLKQLKALEKCKYEVVSADSVYLAGTEVSGLVSNNTINLTSAPALAFAYLQKSLPLKATLNLSVKNPGTTTAGINQFQYILMLKDKELTSGIINQEIRVEPGSSTVIPIKIGTDIFPFVSTSQNRKALMDFFSSEEEKKAAFTLKIKPTLLLGNEKVQFPGYISMDKVITNKQMFDFIKKLNR
jgi:hypothetical protein